MKTKPPLIQIFVLAAMLAPLAPVQAQFIFATNTDGSLIISEYTGPGGAVVIPAATNGLTVTAIGAGAFYERTSLTSVIIPNSITSIGIDVFLGCNSLTSVTIPNNVTSIQMDTFNNCTRLANVTIPNGVTNIGQFAFGLCASLTNVTIPNSVTSIGEFAFVNCSSLTNATIGNSVTNIGEDAFVNCTNLTSVFFHGNAPMPSNDTSVFSEDAKATAYYFPPNIGWQATYDGIPTVRMAPAPALGITTYDGQPVIIYPQYGTNFVLQMTTNLTLTTNLASDNWLTVTNGVSFIAVIITNAPANAFFQLH